MRRRRRIDPYAIINRYIRFTSYQDVLPLENRRASRNILPLIWRDLGYTRGAEIGVCRGEYMSVICSQMPGLTYFGIDPWKKAGSSPQEKMDILYDLSLSRTKGYNATLIRKTSMEALADFENRSLDFVYIDGDHTFDGVVTDIVLWAQKVRRGGMIACHDYCNGYLSGVVKAVDAYTYCHKIDPWFVIGEQARRIETVAPTAFWVNS
jgi:hypothetical protein